MSQNTQEELDGLQRAHMRLNEEMIPLATTTMEYMRINRDLEGYLERARTNKSVPPPERTNPTENQPFLPPFLDEMKEVVGIDLRAPCKEAGNQAGLIFGRSWSLTAGKMNKGNFEDVYVTRCRIWDPKIKKNILITRAEPLPEAYFAHVPRRVTTDDALDAYYSVVSGVSYGLVTMCAQAMQELGVLPQRVVDEHGDVQYVHDEWLKDQDPVFLYAHVSASVVTLYMRGTSHSEEAAIKAFMKTLKAKVREVVRRVATSASAPGPSRRPEEQLEHTQKAHAAALERSRALEVLGKRESEHHAALVKEVERVRAETQGAAADKTTQRGSRGRGNGSRGRGRGRGGR